jgi:hypothetical protein
MPMPPKSKAISYKHLLALQAHLRAEGDEVFALSERMDQGEMPDGLVVSDELAIRQVRLARLAEAKTVLEVRAQERTALEQAQYQGKMQERAQKERQTGRTPPGRPPKAPAPGPRDKDQYNCTDPESRIMKHRSTEGFEQDYNAHIAVDQASLLIVGHARSNHPTEQSELEPTLDAIPSDLGPPKAAALDAGYFREATIDICARRAVEPYIATGGDPHPPRWWERFAELPAPPPEAASPKVKMAYKLKTVLGKAISGLRKCTVEPLIGIIKEVLGFRQFALRGEVAAAGEWCLVCLTFNLKRLPTLLGG